MESKQTRAVLNLKPEQQKDPVYRIFRYYNGTQEYYYSSDSNGINGTSDSKSGKYLTEKEFKAYGVKILQLYTSVDTGRELGYEKIETHNLTDLLAIMIDPNNVI